MSAFDPVHLTVSTCLKWKMEQIGIKWKMKHKRTSNVILNNFWTKTHNTQSNLAWFNQLPKCWEKTMFHSWNCNMENGTWLYTSTPACTSSWTQDSVACNIGSTLLHLFIFEPCLRHGFYVITFYILYDCIDTNEYKFSKGREWQLDYKFIFRLYLAT